MDEKPSYEELERRVLKLETELRRKKGFEKALKDLEMRFSRIFEQSPVSYFICSPDGTLLEFNTAGSKSWNFEEEQPIGNFNLFDDPRIRELDQIQAIKRAFSGEDIEIPEFEYELDGIRKLMSLKIYPIKDEEGAIQNVVVSTEDITDRIEALETMQKCDEKYKTILEDIDEGYFEMDLNGNLTFYSDHFPKIFERSGEELLNNNFREAIDAATVERFVQAAERVYKNDVSEKGIQLEVVTPSLLEKHIEASISLLKEKNRKIGFRGLVRDITEKRQNEEIRESLFRHAVGSLARAAEVYDPDTGDHIVRIGDYGRMLAKLIGMNTEYQKDILISAQLHDVGKIHIASTLLNKMGSLTDNELAQIKNHALYGAIIIGRNPNYKMAYDIAMFHHEKWDGGGYPDGLRGRAIPLAARITSIVDVFDALVSKRSYKDSFDYHEAQSIMKKGDARLDPNVSFDPDLLTIFLSNYEAFVEIHKKSIMAEQEFLRQTMDVLLLDNDRTFQKLLNENYKEELPCVKLSAFSTMAAMDDFLQSNPDYNPNLCFIDVNLPDGSGHTAAERLKTKYPESHLICITADEDIDHTKVHLYGNRVFRKVPQRMKDFFENIVRTTKIVKEYDLNPMRI
ncbi:MAG: PAS domain S-box protein [Proteobacteria bacterium]|nr:PAS domain S-box protein [Pseudomonadota bacterium]